MTVVSNTSPLIALAKIDHLPLLQQLFQTILIPETVKHEFLRNCTPKEKIRFKYAHQEYITVVQVTTRYTFSRTLGDGEQDALSLALQQSANLLLIDDRKGYNEAKEHHLVVASTRAMLKIAEKRGLIDSYQAVEDALRLQSFYVSPY